MTTSTPSQDKELRESLEEILASGFTEETESHYTYESFDVPIVIGKILQLFKAEKEKMAKMDTRSFQEWRERFWNHNE